MTATDRWSCPNCFATTVINGSREDTAAAIAAVQRLHGDVHQQARDEEQKALNEQRVARWVDTMRRGGRLVTPPEKLSA